MKKFILSIIVLGFFIPTGINAQTEKGKVLTGLSSRMGVYTMINSTSTDIFSLGFSSIKNKSDMDGYDEQPADKLVSINLQPKVGYFFIENLAIGLEFSLASFNYKDGTDDDKTNITLFGAGPFARYYIPTDKVTPFFEANALFGSQKYKWSPSDGDNEEEVSSIFSIGGGVGVAIPLSKKVTFDIVAGYNSYTEKAKDDNEDNYRSVIGTFGVKFGFVVFLGSDS